MIKLLREYFGITQQDMAIYIGISRSHLSMIESGRRTLEGNKSSKLVKLFLAVNAIMRSNDSSIDERDLAIAETFARKYDRFFDLQLLTYRHRLWKVDWQLRRRKNDREKNSKRFLQLDILESRVDEGAKTNFNILYTRPVPDNNRELLLLQIKKCSYEAALRFLEEQKEKKDRF